MPVRLSARFKEKNNHLPYVIQSKVKKALKLLDADFRHPGLRSHPIHGYEGIYEAYLDDKYRMTYESKGGLLIMRNIDNHDECLKNP